MPFLDIFDCLLFVIINLLIFKITKQENYWKVLLVTSILYYISFSGYAIFIVFYLSFIIYFISFKIDWYRKYNFLILISLILPLALKKIYISEYQNFIHSSPALKLPNNLTFLGLSYITFNAISYLVDIKRKYLLPQTNYFKLLFYLLYLPIITSGPLLRANFFFGQMNKITLKEDAVVHGLRLILWGLFKNVVVASRIFICFNILEQMPLTGLNLLLKAYIFFLFLCVNFSSYITIFQGISSFFNFKLPENFKNRIYFAQNRQKFWAGWHMTLNQWFKDYVFYELVKKDKSQKYTNWILGLTFVLVALWHDLTIAFLIWGIMNAIWLIAERLIFKKFKIKLIKPQILGIVYHSFFASVLASIFITNDVFTLFKDLFKMPSGIDLTQFETWNTPIVLLSFFIMDYFEKRMNKQNFSEFITQKSKLYRYITYYSLVLFILLFSISSTLENYYNLF